MKPINTVPIRSRHEWALDEIAELSQHLLNSHPSQMVPQQLRGFLTPTICSLSGGQIEVPLEASQSALDILHNETLGYVEYPLSLTKGLFFSEVLGAPFPEAAEYEQWVRACLREIVAGQDEDGFVQFDQIDTIGRRIQQLDAQFAAERIRKELDSVHTYWGPSRAHPYRKMTLCRTTFPISHRDTIYNFFFEKFLVVYSYLDEQGERVPTVTPIHGHPFNHEVVYFARFGNGSRVVEQEFEVCDSEGRALVRTDGSLNPKLFDETGALVPSRLRVTLAAETTLAGTPQPIALEPFGTELAMRDPELLLHTDGLFRPHQVTVHEDRSSGEETLYYAVNNYWGPYGRVWVFDEAGEASEWSHHSWSQWGDRSAAEITPKVRLVD
ncbi:MAG: hypothetical protein U0136_21515 [Bdellovibrionota bacterium]